jgi:hypothetical protein
MAASNCGQILQEREDPFDLKVIDISLLIKKKSNHVFFFNQEANYDFYQDVNKMLSIKPIYFEFPIFRGTVTSTEARAG